MRRATPDGRLACIEEATSALWTELNDTDGLTEAEHMADLALADELASIFGLGPDDDGSTIPEAR